MTTLNNKPIAEWTEAEKEANRVRRIKVGVTVVALLVMVGLIAYFWNGEGDYQFKISTDDGYEWNCKIDNETLIGIESEEYVDGKYSCVLKGLSEGTTDVHLTCYEKGDTSKVVEKRTYTFQVDETGHILQRNVERELFDE